MGNDRPPRATTPSAHGDDKPAQKASLRQWGRGFLLGQLIGTVFGPFIRLIAAGFLGAGGIFLLLAWQAAPQKALDSARYAKYTEQVQGTIVESWLALEVDTASIRLADNWRASSLATPCALVQYENGWGAPTRRAFCGSRLPLGDDYALHDLRELSSGIPFAWARDASGFIVPEMRVDARTTEWLTTHSLDHFMHPKWPAGSALDDLRIEFDRPVDYAVAGWIAPAAVMPLAFDPRHPAEALPSGYVAAHRHWQPLALILAAVLGVIGLGVWFEGMTVLLGEGMALPARLLIAILPLLALPWWGEHFPRALSSLNAQWASVISGMLRDVEGVDRLVASDPAQAMLADGERRIWRTADSIYADTFGRLRYTLPNPPPPSADAALAALAQTVTTQMRALGEAERVGIFSRLTVDTENGLLDGGIVFLPAAKEATLDAQSGPTLRRAAAGFVSARLAAQFGRPYPTNLGYHERERLYEDARGVEGKP